MEIHIQQYPVFMRLGYYSMERLMGQEVLVSVDAELGDLYLEHADDDLGNSIDYGKIIGMIEQVLLNREIKLVETAVASLGNAMMHRFESIQCLRVLIEKPILPNGLGKGAKVSVSHSFDRKQKLSY
ncbi:MAG: dihydroneopterin aldolase [Oligoflexales bacterium]|nr:dihydroneopterin aldolase [Oligoflexales bacterium]